LNRELLRADGSAANVFHDDWSGCCTGRHRGSDEARVKDRERRADAVERHRSRTDEVATANRDLGADGAAGGCERRDSRCGCGQASVKAPDGSTCHFPLRNRSAIGRSPVDLAVGTLNHTAVRKAGVGAAERNILQNRAGFGRHGQDAAVCVARVTKSGPQVAIGSLNGGTDEKPGENADLREELEIAAGWVDLAELSLIQLVRLKGTIEGSAGGLHELTVGGVDDERRRKQRVSGQNCEHAAGGEAENVRSRAVEVSIRTLDQGDRHPADFGAAVEFKQRGKRAGRRKAEDGATTPVMYANRIV
jgi:hypothetical protein